VQIVFIRKKSLEFSRNGRRKSLEVEEADNPFKYKITKDNKDNKDKPGIHDTVYGKGYKGRQTNLLQRFLPENFFLTTMVEPKKKGLMGVGFHQAFCMASREKIYRLFLSSTEEQWGYIITWMADWASWINLEGATPITIITRISSTEAVLIKKPGCIVDSLSGALQKVRRTTER
jgi:hypothetical protein